MHIMLLASYAPSLLKFRGPLIRDLIAAGHCVSTSAPDVTAQLRSQLADLGAEVHDIEMERTGTGILADLRYHRSLRKLLAYIRPDVLLTYTIKPNIWGAFAAASTGVPSVAMVTGLGYIFTDAGKNRSLTLKLTRLLARRLYRAATNQNRFVIFQNSDDRDDFIKAGCLPNPAKAAIVNGSGVDLEHYTLTSLPEKPVVLMIARLLGNKGVREYVDAAQQLRKLRPQSQFILVGPFDGGPDSIRRKELDRCIAEGLDYRGEVDDVRPVISEARIYVLPSYREGTPRSVLEAMAMGRPIITTDVPGCRETVSDGENGLLVPPRDPEALTIAIARLLDNPSEAARMGEVSYQIVTRRYDVRKVNKSIIDLLEI